MGSYIITKATTRILHNKKSWHIVSRWKQKGGQSDKALPKGEILRT
ncbi:hypothetical protein CGLO_13094 [Colletotrichum gloeosporioides Cg-14]|uniref:Uncharacterized protein n=1 Tax=Colletotrichum gloeosporioides (strain Cg-14) TaxID=1237896 RepID=T0L7Y1_COLGC|nr:hypothetical protein CGLO_13094 [Colletotrichum gloeosporioides Cg-14]